MYKFNNFDLYLKTGCVIIHCMILKYSEFSFSETEIDETKKKKCNKIWEFKI